MNDIIDFKSLQLGSNDSIDYFQLNRVLDRTYDFLQTVSGNVSVAYSPLSSIPYATENSLGFVQFSENFPQSNDFVISSTQISSYIVNEFSTSSTSSSIASDLYITSGYNKLLNGLKLQFGNFLIDTSASSANVQTYSPTINFNNMSDSEYDFTFTPILLIQIIDNKDFNKYKYKYNIFNISNEVFDICLNIENVSGQTIAKSNFYISWLAIGV